MSILLASIFAYAADVVCSFYLAHVSQCMIEKVCQWGIDRSFISQYCSTLQCRELKFHQSQSQLTYCHDQCHQRFKPLQCCNALPCSVPRCCTRPLHSHHERHWSTLSHPWAQPVHIMDLPGLLKYPPTLCLGWLISWWHFHLLQSNGWV